MYSGIMEKTMQGRRDVLTTGSCDLQLVIVYGVRRVSPEVISTKTLADTLTQSLLWWGHKYTLTSSGHYFLEGLSVL